MAGIIREAKEIRRFLEKRKKEYEKNIMLGLDYGCTLDERLEVDMEDAIQKFKKDCQIAMRLRDVAIEVGLMKKPALPTIENNRLVGKHCLMTIRPDNGTDFATFKHDVETFTKRCYLLNGEYAFEQCGECEEELGNGFHVHILAQVKNYVQFQELKRDVHKDVRGQFMFQVGNDRHKFLKTETDLEYCRNYIRGDKHNEDKVAACLLNDTWRAMNNLNEIYYFNNESSTAVVVEID